MLSRAPSSVLPSRQRRRLGGKQHQQHLPRPTAAAAAAKTKTKRKNAGAADVVGAVAREKKTRPSSSSPLSLAAAAAAAFVTSASFLPSAALASQKVCFDVPDWAAGPLTSLSDPPSLLAALLKSPPLAAVAALAAAALLPRALRLARASLKYAVLALALWVAVSHPKESAGAVEAALDFAQHHPVAASSLLVAAVAVSVGPEALATGAAVGALVLLASAAGLIELPSLGGGGGGGGAPRFPRLPSWPSSSAAVVERLERAVGGGGGGAGAGGD